MKYAILPLMFMLAACNAENKTIIPAKSAENKVAATVAPEGKCINGAMYKEFLGANFLMFDSQGKYYKC